MSLQKRIESYDVRVGVIGLGYVGLPLAVTAAKRGYSVVGFDIDAKKMTRLSAGKSYIDAVADSDLQDVTRNKRLAWTTEFARLADCSVILICVPTPLTAHREPDLSFVEETVRQIARNIQADTLVILESTTFPGTTEDIVAPILESSGLSVGKDIFLGFSPEREDPGNDRFTTRTIPKIVAGTDSKSGDMVEAFYKNVVETVVRVSTTGTAEAVKITENIFRAVNIALVNELKLIYDKMGIDVWEVIDGAATKPFGFMPFYPGPGLGGHCIPIDPFYLTWKAREYGVSTRFIELAGEINTHMPHHVVDRLREVLDRTAGTGLSNAHILLVGVAYKKNVADMRESPSMKLMQLIEQAGAQVAYLDPHVPSIPPMRQYPMFSGRASMMAEDIRTGRFDAVLISTDHDAIDYSQLIELGCPVIDTRNAIARRDLPMTNVHKA